MAQIDEKETTDEVVQEIRTIKERLAESLQFDIDRILDAARQTSSRAAARCWLRRAGRSLDARGSGKALHQGGEYKRLHAGGRTSNVATRRTAATPPGSCALDARFPVVRCATTG